MSKQRDIPFSHISFNHQAHLTLAQMQEAARELQEQGLSEAEDLMEYVLRECPEELSTGRSKREALQG